MVPPNIYDDIKQQNYLSESGTVCKTLDSIVEGIKQYVLTVDLFAA